MATYKVFLYGTLKRHQPKHCVITSNRGKAEFLGTGHTVSNYPLVIASIYNLPFILDKEGSGKIVQGEVYDVDDTMLSALDSFEEAGIFYEREMIRVVLTETKKGEVTVRELICGIYMLRHYKPDLLNLPYLDSYDSDGPHGKPYIEETTDIKHTVMNV